MKTFNSETEYRDFVFGLKREQRFGSVILWIGWFFWFIETIVFMCIYGFHVGPANSVERTLDSVATIIMYVGVFLLLHFSYRTSKFFTETMLPPEVPENKHPHHAHRHTDQ